MGRKAYPIDISAKEWNFVAPYPVLINEEAPQRHYPLCWRTLAIAVS
jgi:hypothetical protein